MQTAPAKKLVALYVLDSIVKNVGTPYNVYLQGNLYGTFMGAYTQVDPSTRRNMEAIVKTWKEPVPGSMDPRPVFPHEVVQPIENALIKAKTVALQSGRPVQAPGYRNTPTPPQYGGHYAAPAAPAPAQSQPWQSYPNHQVTPSSALPGSPDHVLTAFRPNLIHSLPTLHSHRRRSNTSNTYMHRLRHSSNRSVTSKVSNVMSLASSPSAKCSSVGTHGTQSCKHSSRRCCSFKQF